MPWSKPSLSRSKLPGSPLSVVSVGCLPKNVTEENTAAGNGRSIVTVVPVISTTIDPNEIPIPETPIPTNISDAASGILLPSTNSISNTNPPRLPEHTINLTLPTTSVESYPIPVPMLITYSTGSLSKSIASNLNA